jgi:hypothetical protein
MYEMQRPRAATSLSKPPIARQPPPPATSTASPDSSGLVSVAAFRSRDPRLLRGSESFVAVTEFLSRPPKLAQEVSANIFKILLRAASGAPNL